MKNLLNITVLTILALGCAAPEYIDSRAPNAMEELMIEKSYKLLTDVYGPSTERCEQELPMFRVASFDTIEEVDYFCDPTQEGKGLTYGCFFYDTGYAGHEGSPTIAYGHHFGNYLKVFLHEFTHWYATCALGEDIDREHMNIVWDYVEEVEICLLGEECYEANL